MRRKYQLFCASASGLFTIAVGWAFTVANAKHLIFWSIWDAVFFVLNLWVTIGYFKRYLHASKED